MRRLPGGRPERDWISLPGPSNHRQEQLLSDTHVLAGLLAHDISCCARMRSPHRAAGLRMSFQSNRRFADALVPAAVGLRPVHAAMVLAALLLVRRAYRPL